MDGNVLDKLNPFDENEECNHDHFDVLLVSEHNKKQFKKAIIVFSRPLKEDGTVDYGRPFNEGYVLSEVEMKARRKTEIEKYVPLIKKERRGRHLLRKHLNKQQLIEYHKFGSFLVESNNRKFQVSGYKGVNELDENGKIILHYCLHGKALDLPQSDVLLIQKLLITTNLEEFERVANKTLPFEIGEFDVGPLTIDLTREQEVSLAQLAQTIDVEIMEDDTVDVGRLEWLQMEYEGHMRFQIPMDWNRAFEEVQITDNNLKQRILNSIANNEYTVYAGENGIYVQ